MVLVNLMLDKMVLVNLLVKLMVLVNLLVKLMVLVNVMVKLMVLVNLLLEFMVLVNLLVELMVLMNLLEELIDLVNLIVKLTVQVNHYGGVNCSGEIYGSADRIDGYGEFNGEIYCSGESDGEIDGSCESLPLKLKKILLNQRECPKLTFSLEVLFLKNVKLTEILNMFAKDNFYHQHVLGVFGLKMTSHIIY